MAVVACPGTCNYWYREAQAAYKQAVAEYDPLAPDQSRPEPPDIRPWPGEPFWCTREAATIRRELAELDYLTAMLARAADGQRGQRPGAKMPPKGKKHGGPTASPTADMLEELAGDLREWESAVRGGEPLGRRGHLDTETSMMIAWLCGRGRFERAMLMGRPVKTRDGREVPWAVRFGEDVREWRRKLVRITKAGTGVHHKPVRCPRCEELALFWTEGDDYVECKGKGGTCGRLISLDDYDELARAQAAATGDTGPLPAKTA